MTSFLAIQMEGTDARLLLAGTERKNVRVRQAQTVTGDSVTERTDAIRSVVNSWNAQGTPLLMAIDREECELRRLTVPDVGPDELPDLVRYQAMQNFSALAPDAPLDFVSLPSPSSGRSVLAAAISSERLQTAMAFGDSIGCPLQAMILLPCATAALAQAAYPLRNDQAQVVIRSGAGAISILVMVGPIPVLMRSVRTQGGALPDLDILKGEVRRTMGAAKAEQPNLRVERIVVCGSGARQRDIAKSLHGEGESDIVFLSHWPGAEESSDGLHADSEQAAGFLPLVGMVVAETQTTDTMIDFRRPRKPPVAPDNSQLYKAMALAGILLLLGAFLLIRWQLGKRDKDLEFVQSQINQNEKPVVDSEKMIDDLHAVENWFVNSPNWMDELQHLSLQIPPAEQVRLREVSCVDQSATSVQTMETQDRGRITLKGLLDSAATLSLMQDAIRDQNHRVESAERNQRPDEPDYPWQFGDTIFISTGNRENDVADNPTGSDVPTDAASPERASVQADVVTQNAEPHDPAPNPPRKQSGIRPGPSEPSGDAPQQNTPVDALRTRVPSASHSPEWDAVEGSSAVAADRSVDTSWPPASCSDKESIV